MKILVIPAWYSTAQHPNAGIFIKVQVQALADEKIEMAVIYADLAYQYLTWPNQSSYVLEDGIPTFRSKGFFPPKINNYLLKKWANNYKPLYKRYVEKFGKPDLIHAHSYMAAIAANALSRAYNIPYLITEHLTQVATEKLPANRIDIIREAYDGASKIIAVSEYLKKRIVKLTSTNTVVIPNLVDTRKFSPDPVQRSQEKALKFISVGGLIPQKNYSLLINSFALFLKAGHRSKLSIIGDGQEKKELQKMIDSLGIAEDVLLLGEKSQEDVVTLLRKADVFVSSSRVETFGVAIIEAMSVGLPVVATRSGGAEGIVGEGNGVLVGNGSVEELGKALIMMAENIEKYSRTKIRSNTVENYNSPTIAKQIIKVYESILSNIND